MKISLKSFFIISGTKLAYFHLNFASNMSLNQEDFTKAMIDMQKIVKKVLSGKNEVQKTLLKMNLKAFQNLCEISENSNQNYSNLNKIDSEIKVEDNPIDVIHESDNIDASKETGFDRKIF